MGLHDQLLIGELRGLRCGSPGFGEIWMRHLIATAFAVLCIVLLGRSEASALRDIEARYNALAELAQAVAERPQIEQAPTVRAEFERTLAHAYTDGALQRASDLELRFLLRAGDDLGFFSYARADLPYVERPLQVLERRGVANDDDRARYFRVLVGLRLFEQARAYRVAHPAMDVEQVPAVVDIRRAERPRRLRNLHRGVDENARVDRFRRASGGRCPSALCVFAAGDGNTRQ